MPLFLSAPNVEKLKAKRDVEGLAKALNYPKDFAICRAAAAALQDLGWPPKKDALGARYWILLGKAEECVSIGAEAVEPLAAVVDNPDNSLAVAAITALGSLADERAVKSISTVLYGGSKDVKLASIQALEKIGGLESVKALNVCMHMDKDANVQEIAAMTLAKLGGEEAIQDLIFALRFNYVKKPVAVEALVRIGSAAVEPLMALFNDKDVTVWEAACTALGKIGDRRAVEPMLALLGKSSVVAEALGRIGDERAVEPLIAELQKEIRTTYASGAVAKALGDIGDRRAVEPLTEAFKSSMSWEITVEAVQTLSQFGEQSIVEPLIKHDLFSPGHRARELAAKALEKLNWQPGQDAAGAAFWIEKEQWEKVVAIGEPAVEPLINALQNSYNGWYAYMANAALSLGQIGDLRAVDPLLLALEGGYGGYPQVRKAAAIALGKLGDKRARDALLHASVTDKDANVRTAAAEAVALLIG